MKLSKIFIYCFLFLFTLNLSAGKRDPSPPYITGDGFRAHCDYILDETGCTIEPNNVAHGDTIFVKTDLLGTFFDKFHDSIANNYILVSHNSDHPAPGNYYEYLNDDKIIAWFAQNVEGPTHPKLHPIPIGLENRYNGHGDLSVIDKMRDKYAKLGRWILLYMNINVGTSPTERGQVYNYFKDKPYCTVSSPKPYVDYLQDLASSRFVLSPRGNGLDCHRTWESLYMGSTPIVRSTACDSMYKNLPVIIVNEWSDVTPDFLAKKALEMSIKEYNMKKIYLKYWLKKIDSYKK